MEDNMIHVHVRITVKPDRIREFMRLAKHHVACSRREVGCLRFDLLEDRDVVHVYHLHEVFADEAALLVHQQTPHYRYWSNEIPAIQAEQRRHEEGTLLELDVKPVVVFTNGCFDTLHCGHLHLLREACKMGDRLIVGLNDDDSVRRLKGPGRPVQGVKTRCAVLAALRCVDEVRVFDTEKSLDRMVEAIRPDILVKGSDAAGKHVPGSNHAGEVRYVEMLPGYSTTATVRRVLAM